MRRGTDRRVAAGNASAAEWLLDDAPIAEAKATEGSGTFELTDEGGFLGSSVTVKCSGTTTGTAGPGAAGATSAATVKECVTVQGTCGSPKASAVDLPWSAELFESGGVVRDKILADGHGVPGYRVECTVFGITVTDTCTSESGQPEVANEESPVPVVFDAESGTYSCSVGGSGKGHIRGTVSISSPEGALAAGERWLSVKKWVAKRKKGSKVRAYLKKLVRNAKFSSKT